MKAKSLLIALTAVFCLSAIALGFSWGGKDVISGRLSCVYAEGETDGAIHIGSSEDWAAVAEEVAGGNDYLGVSIYLDKDISIGIAIGSRDNPFRGNLYGSGRVITADISGGDYCAPIGYLDSGEVSGLGVSGKISGKQSAGGVVGYNYKGTVTSCYFRGDITADNYAGGVVGVNMGIIESCYALAQIKASEGDTYAGGVAGFNDYDGVIKNCYYVGKVECASGGGVVGYAGRGNLTGCYYNKEQTKSAYAAASECIITDTEGLVGDEMSGSGMKLGDKFEYKTTGSDWGCYPSLKAFDYTRFEDYNSYAGWCSHLINCNLLIAVQDDGINISALREGRQLADGYKRGYEFAGWYTAPDNGERIEYVEGGGDKIIYGRYDIITYTITYSLAGGAWSEGYTAVTEYTVLDEVKLPTADNLYMADSNFSGWSTAEGKTLSVIEKGSIGDITLTAQFKLKPVAVISRVVEDYIWIIADIAGALIILVEIAVLLKFRRKRESKSYSASAFIPMLTSALFYPVGMIIFAVEVAAMLILPIIMLVRRKERQTTAEVLATCEDMFIELMPESPLLLGAGDSLQEGLAEIKDMDMSITYGNSFTARMIMSNEAAKKYYCAVKGRLLSYRRVHGRVSWSGETFTAGRTVIAKITVSGNTIKLHLAINCNEVEGKYFAKDNSSIKRYESVPTCVKIKSDRGLKRALTLIDKVAEKNGLIMRGEGEGEVIFNHAPMSKADMLEKGYIKSKVNIR